jgi:hypothetical protein
MASVFYVALRTAKAKDQEISQPFFGVMEVIRRIHRAQDGIAWDLTVEIRDEPPESILSDRGIDFVFFQSLMLASRRTGQTPSIERQDRVNARQGERLVDHQRFPVPNPDQGPEVAVARLESI